MLPRMTTPDDRREPAAPGFLASYRTTPPGDWFLARVTAVGAGSPQTYSFDEWWLKGDGTWGAKAGGRVGDKTKNPGYTLPAADLSEQLLAVGDFAHVRGGDGAGLLYWEMMPAQNVTSWKTVVRAATTGNGLMGLDYANGSVIDGVTLATGDRILIKDQSAPDDNGIYVVAASGAPSRAHDANSGDKMVGMTVVVSEGTRNADTIWLCTTNAPITADATNLSWVKVFPQELTWKEAVRAATTQNGTLSTAYANGSIIDGVTLATNDRILLKNQTTASQNGIYVVQQSGTPVRAPDSYKIDGTHVTSAVVHVREGNLNADTTWAQTTDGVILPDTTSIAYTQLHPGVMLCEVTTSANPHTVKQKTNSAGAIADVSPTQSYTNCRSVTGSLIPVGSIVMMWTIPGTGERWIAPAYATDETIQDAVGAMVLDSTTVDFTYNDGLNTLTAAVIYQKSITADASGIKLDGDSTTPGNSMFYSTNGSGVKGWYALSLGIIPLSGGGTGANLTDPGADRILFWDDSGNAVTWLSAGTGLAIGGTQIDCTLNGLPDYPVADGTYSLQLTIAGGLSTLQWV